MVCASVLCAARRQTGRQLLRHGVRARYRSGSWRLGALLEPRASARAGPAFLFMDFMHFIARALAGWCSLGALRLSASWFDCPLHVLHALHG